MSDDSITALIGALSTLVVVLVTSLRKREDTRIEELQRRNAALEAELVEAENARTAADDRADAYQASLLGERRTTFTLRLTLADHGIDDPTAP
ncbi:MAG: hypothetical protein F2667_04375 [Actinobacteria bacterium]|uniref:Unannotated protein n=1 Tax=freshwater metagenome TaxID=449393 RepID=A0A6J6PHD0_9ZZZZ|nr:hypothetical protein [Actinomycetota bacterium]